MIETTVMKYLNNPFKAFYCLPDDPLIVKPNAYIIDMLRLIYCYLSSRKQRVKINDVQVLVKSTVRSITRSYH